MTIKKISCSLNGLSPSPRFLETNKKIELNWPPYPGCSYRGGDLCKILINCDSFPEANLPKCKARVAL